MPRTSPEPALAPARERILKASARLFSAVGYAATSMQDIKVEAGVLRGSLYFHFPSKEALALEVLDAFFQSVSSALKSALKRPGDSALNTLVKTFGSIPEDMIHNGFQGGCLLGNFGQELSRFETSRPRLQTRFEQLVATVATFLALAEKRGELARNLKPEPAARLFVCAFHGALIELRTYKDRAVYDECMATLLSLLRGVA